MIPRSAILGCLALLALSASALAAPAPITLRDIGVLGLASHDLFQWNKAAQKSEENGRLDLSTIFDYAGGAKIQEGGNPKNSENAPVFTISRLLVLHYSLRKADLIKYAHLSEADAHAASRRETVSYFIGMVKTSFARLMGMSFPEQGLFAEVTHEEQASMRALHDVLPGTMRLDRALGQSTADVTDYRLARTFLSPEELDQTVAAFDGQYDPRYLSIALPHGPIVSLQDEDRAFIEAKTSYKQAAMLAELGQKPVASTSFAHHLTALFRKGLCSTGNAWIPASLPCLAQ
jgi:hypothetical protein